MDVLNLMAKISLDSSEYDKGLDNASSKASSFGTKLKKGVTVAGKAIVAGIGVASTAVAGLVGTAVKSFGDYEQLVGGINTLYKDASDEMLAYANNAYKTAGLSANEYMQTAIDSSAAMIASLDGDTKKAAKLTDMAITDMADNANKMGTSMESLQNAYKGFSRGNFTMLDNLALGFAGTKEGMQELLDKAEELSGVHYDISSYADIVQAIHVVQEEMDIAGATAEEAMGTIQGSLNMTESAWQNLVTGIANPDADLGQLISNFVDSASAFGENILPVVEQALNGVAKLIEELLPKILERLPGLINDLLPGLLDAATNVITTLAQSLPELITSQLPVILDAIIAVVEALLPQIPTILESLLTAIMNALGGLADKLPEIIPQIVELIVGIADILLSNIDKVLDVAFKIIEGLAEGLIKALPVLIQKLPDIIKKLINAMINLLVGGIPKFIEMGIKLFVSLVKELPAIIAGIVEAIPEIIDAILEALTGLEVDLASIFQSAWEAIVAVWSVVVDFFSGIWNGISEVFSGVITWFTDLFSNAWNGIVGIWNQVVGFFSGIWNGIVGVFSSVGSWFTGIFQSAWDGITGIFNKLGGFFSGVWDSIVGIFKDAGVAVGDAISGAVKGAINAVLRGATGIINGFISAINTAISVINAIPGVSISKLSKLDAPQLEKGGILERGQVGILEGNGAEAVVPLERNSKWIRAVARDMQGEFNLAGAGGDIIIPVYIGTDRLDEMVVKANQIHNFRSGGVGNV